MQRKWWLVSGVGLAVVVAAIAFRSVTPSKPKMNVILITLDTTRADHLGCYGYHRDTSPHIDSVAQNAVVKDNGILQQES